MSQAEIYALTFRDQAMRVALAKGAITVPEQHTFTDARLRIEFWPRSPHALDIWKRSDRETKVFGQIWTPDGDAVMTVDKTGSWETSLARLAKVRG